MKAEELKRKNLIVFDIEGSGNSAGSTPYEGGAIVSLGAVDFKTSEEFYEECRIMDGRSYDLYALKINGFSPEQITDPKKQAVSELLKKFENFCLDHNSMAIGAWGEYDLKMLKSAYSYYSKEWGLPNLYINLKDISRLVLGTRKPGLSNTAAKLGIPREEEPHIAINGARLAAENISLILYGKHYYESYAQYPIPNSLNQKNKPEFYVIDLSKKKEKSKV